MTKQQYTKLKKLIKKAINEAENRLLKEGVDITSDKVEEALLKVKHRIIENQGFSVIEFESFEQEKEVETKNELKGEKGESIKGERGEKGEKGDSIVGPPGKDGKTPKPQIINKIVKIKPQIIKEIVKEVDNTKIDQLHSDIKELQLSHTDLIDNIQSKISKKELKNFQKDLEKYVNQVVVTPRGRVSDKGGRFFNWGMPDAGSYGTAIADSRYYKKSEVDTLIATSAGQWDRNAGTSTLTPKTANDSVNLGSGNFTTTGTGTFGTITDGSLSITSGAITAIDNLAFNSSANNRIYDDASGLAIQGATDIVFSLGTGTWTLTLDNAAGTLKSSAGYFNFDDDDLKTTGVVWGQGLADTAGTFIIDNVRKIYEADGTLAGDFEVRQLLSSDGIDVVLDWETVGLAQFGDSAITTTGLLTGGTIQANGNITLQNGEIISNTTDDMIDFIGGAGSTNVTLRLDLDDTDPTFSTTTSDQIRFADCVYIENTSVSTGYLLQLYKVDYDLTSVAKAAAYFSPRATTGGSGTMTALLMDARYTGTQAQTGDFRGFWGQINQYGSGLISEMAGVRGSVNIQIGGGNVTNMYGINSGGLIAETVTSSVATFADMYAEGINANDGDVTVAAYNFYGSAHAIDVGAFSGDAYGIYLEEQTAGAANYEMMLAGGGGIFFRDSAIHIESVADGYLDLTADTAVRINTGLVIPSGTTPAPAVEGALFLDTDAGTNGTLVIYSNGGWRTVAVL